MRSWILGVGVGASGISAAVGLPGRTEPVELREGWVLPPPAAGLDAAVLGEVAARAGWGRMPQVPGQLVVAVPPGWDREQAEGLKAAAGAAGLPEPLVIPAPMAVAWHLAQGTGRGRLIAVLDAGDGGAYVALLRRAGRGFELAGEPGSVTAVAGAGTASLGQRAGTELAGLLAEADASTAELAGLYATGPLSRDRALTDAIAGTLGVPVRPAPDPATATACGAVELVLARGLPAAAPRPAGRRFQTRPPESKGKRPEGKGRRKGVILAAASGLIVVAAAVLVLALLVPRGTSPGTDGTGSGGRGSGGTAPPAVVYVTNSSVVLRNGTSTRVLATIEGVQGLAWSPDGTQVAWLTSTTLSVARLSGGAVRSWPCSGCSGVEFQGQRAVVVPLSAAGGEMASATPELLEFPADGSASPQEESVTGIAPGGSGTDFRLLADLPDGHLVVAYGSAGGSDLGGTQLLYSVDLAGHAVEYGKTSLRQLPTSSAPVVIGDLDDFTVDRSGSEAAFITYARAGICGGVDTLDLLDTASGSMTVPDDPAGGGPDGFWVEGLWFDPAGVAYASLIPNMTNCATYRPGTAPTFYPPHARPIVYKRLNGTWTRTGSSGVFQAGYGPAGWAGQLTGTSPEAASYTLVLIRGAADITIPGVSEFEWAP